MAIIRAVNGLGKLLLAAGAGAAALAVLLVLYAGARQRGRLAHCRNNLRHLGGMAVRNWGILDPGRPGREFWQQVREAQYRDVRGNWQPLDPDPFVCPVLGTTESKPQSSRHIDYLGPAAVPEQPKDLPRGAPLGADRPGNHPSGGHVLRLDTSVDDLRPAVEAFPRSAREWEEAVRALKD